MGCPVSITWRYDDRGLIGFFVLVVREHLGDQRRSIRHFRAPDKRVAGELLLFRCRR